MAIIGDREHTLNLIAFLDEASLVVLLAEAEVGDGGRDREADGRGGGQGGGRGGDAGG